MYNLKLRNFQSIEKQDFQFKGFVAITGPSNLGKSAVRRSFGSVAYNDWDAGYQRQGSDKCIVQFEKPSDDLKIKMTKSEKDGDNEFKLITHIGEQTFAKVGRSIPEEISDLGFSLLTTGDESFNLQISTQLESLFMVTYNGATNTKILNKIFNVSKLEKASDLVGRDSKKIKSELNRKVETYNEKVVQRDKISTQHDELQKSYDRALLLFTNVQMIDELDTSITNLSTSIDDYNHAEKLFTTQETYLNKLKSYQQLFAYLDEVFSLEVYTLNGNDTDFKIELTERKLSTLNKITLISTYDDNLKQYVWATVDFDNLNDKVNSSIKQLDILSNVVLINDYLTSDTDYIITGNSYDLLSGVITNHEKVSKLLSDTLLINDYLISQEDYSHACNKLTSLSKNDTFVSNFDNNRMLINHIYHREKLETITKELGELDSKEHSLSSLVVKLKQLQQMSTYLEHLADISKHDSKISDVDLQISVLTSQLESMPRCEKCKQLLTADHID